MTVIATADLEALGCRVRLAVTDPAGLERGKRSLEAHLAAVDATYSRFRADSELMRLSAYDGRPAPVSPLLAGAVAAALRAARLTDGDVDPTVGGALVALGYDRDLAALAGTAGPAVRVVTRPVPGWQRVRLSGHLLTVPGGVLLDLGAVGKAYAADLAAGRLAAELGCGVLVSLGGDIAVAGPAPSGGWRVRAQERPGSPDEPAKEGSAVIGLSSGGLATSSVLARSWRRGGRRLHHIVDPRTSRPADSPWRTVTVAAASCVDANAASTAAIVRGGPATAWLARLGLPARLVDTTGRVTTVAGWPTEVAA